jgi:hypothetical protein
MLSGGILGGRWIMRRMECEVNCQLNGLAEAFVITAADEEYRRRNLLLKEVTPVR